jgi:hypothetical protein
LVMTAVPGAPRRLWLSSSPRRGAFGRLAALAVISVGRRFMGTLRVRTWRLCGADTTGRLMHHNKDSTRPVPDRVLPRIVRNRDALYFANPVPSPACRLNRPTQLRTIRGNLIGNLRISLATFQHRAGRDPAPARRNAVCDSPARSRPPPLRCRGARAQHESHCGNGIATGGPTQL